MEEILAAFHPQHHRLAEHIAVQVLTSFSVADDADSLWLIASTRLPQRQGSWPSLKLRIPRLDASFTGTGKPLTFHPKHLLVMRNNPELCA